MSKFPGRTSVGVSDRRNPLGGRLEPFGTDLGRHSLDGDGPLDTIGLVINASSTGCLRSVSLL